jgi:hypothetical protein
MVSCGMFNHRDGDALAVYPIHRQEDPGSLLPAFPPPIETRISNQARPGTQVRSKRLPRPCNFSPGKGSHRPTIIVRFFLQLTSPGTMRFFARFDLGVTTGTPLKTWLPICPVPSTTSLLPSF